MSSGNVNSYPGLNQPQVKSMPAGTPRDSAIATQEQMNTKQANLNASVGGSKRRRRYRGGAVVVPQFQMQYQPTGAGGQNPNDIIKNGSSTSMQSTANGTYDNQATNMNGGKRHHKGGSSNWSWGCYSGGRRTKRRHSRKSRRHRHKKTRRHYRR